MTATVWLLLLSLSALPGVGPPYIARPVPTTNAGGLTTVVGMVWGDVDADRVNELISGVKTGIVVNAWRDGEVRVIDQINFAPRFVEDGGRVQLGAVRDLDGDGRAELLATARDGSGREQRYWVVDLHSGTWLVDVPLPAGPDVRRDGQWDGSYPVLAVLPTPERTLVILARNVQYDRLTRAVVALDARTGEQVWTLPTAGNPGRAVVQDLDGDGGPEVVIGVGSAGNLKPGEEVGGRLDDASWVIVLDAAGQLRWESRLSTTFDNPQLVVCELDGAGNPEVIVATRCVSEGFVNTVRVLDGATGALITAADLGPPVPGLWAWRDRDAAEGVVVGAVADGRLVRFTYSDRELRTVATKWLPAAPHGLEVADFLPEPGPEFLVGTNDFGMHLLSATLRPLADLSDRTEAAAVAIWDLGRNSIIMYPNEKGVGFRLEPAPVLRRYTGPAGVGTVLVGAGVMVGALARQRQRLRRLRRTGRRDLLRAFLTSRHGTVGPVAALERTLWSIENAGPSGREALPGIWNRCRTEAVPDLEALLEKAAQIRLDPPLLAIVRRELARSCRLLEDLAELDPADSSRPGLIVAAHTSLGLVGDGVRSLGATLAASCVLDPKPLVRGLVARHSARSPAVVFALQIAPQQPPRLCHADAADLEFAVDNLLDNAVRQVVDREQPNVTVTMRSDAERLFISVTDNGPGVPADQRERIFAPGVSTRQGGGLGLWHSREALRYYGGDLTVEDGPAGGARFNIRLRTAHA